MYKINKSAIVKGREQNFITDTTFDGYKIIYPIDEVKKCHYEVKASKQDGFILLLFKIDAKLTVFDTRDNVKFSYPCKLSDSVEIFENEEDFESGLYLPGPSIDLDDVALGLIHASLPIRLIRKGEANTPKNIKNINFLKEDETKEEISNFSLDGLPDFPSK